ncbi:hypothetical protein AgCh_019317 [Apium graveolens]
MTIYKAYPIRKLFAFEARNFTSFHSDFDFGPSPVSHFSNHKLSGVTSTNYKAPLSDISNKFIEENFTIADFQAEEGELFWDDECHNDQVNDIILDKNLENSEKLDQPVPKGYLTLGPPTETCCKCGAVMWKEERSNKDVTKDEGDDPKFCQLYIYDTEHEVVNRMKWVKVDDGESIDAEIVEGFKEQPVRDLKIKLKICRAENGRENLIGPSDEVSCVMVGDIDTTVGDKDIIVEKKKNDDLKDIIMQKCGKPLERISSIHPSLMALQYPLLFPLGEDGYNNQFPYVDSETQKKEGITMKEYYGYRLQYRKNEGLHVRLAGHLYQQYVVDVFSCIEQARLWWLRTHQTNLRSDLYKSIVNKAVSGTTDASNVGNGFVLPANFLGSRRYMQQNFQDVLAVCHAVGHHDIFLTMTTNPLWDEILQMMKIMSGCSARDSPDVIARVFHLKLEQLLDDIRKKKYFGTCIGVMYVVEFQKCGLPHVHMLIWLDSESKKKLSSNVDTFVSAEIPDPITDPVGYEAVKSLMIHGPCGLQNTQSSCMNNCRCTKHFPKKYCRETYSD